MDAICAFPLLDLRTLQHGRTASSAGCVNQELVDLLACLIARTTDPKDHRRLASFKKAHTALSSHPVRISCGKQAKKEVVGVGAGIANRIDEYFATGTLAELKDSPLPNNGGSAYHELCTVTGIGEARAKTLVDVHGVTSVDDLRSRYASGALRIAPNELTHHVVVGLRHYHDLQQRMPWSEADAIAKQIREVLPPSLKLTFCGSYRREQPTCGDLDMIVCGSASDGTGLADIVRLLTVSGVLVDHLTDPDRGKGSKYMGVCMLRGKPGAKARRIDIRLIPEEALGAAMLYFTGSAKFNVLMRDVALKRGYTLNEYGLWTYANGAKGKLVSAATEEAVFKCLNLVFVPPQERHFL